MTPSTAASAHAGTLPYRLLPCPFCGGKPLLEIGQNNFIDVQISCQSCNMVGPDFDNDEAIGASSSDPKADAIKHWNERALNGISQAPQETRGDEPVAAVKAKLAEIKEDRSVVESYRLGRIEGMYIAIEAIEAAAPQPRLAKRLTDVVMMLDTPDAYNREYVAAVCRSILSSVVSSTTPVALVRRSEADAYFKILQTIARFPITDPKNMDAVNMRLIAEGACAVSNDRGDK